MIINSYRYAADPFDADGISGLQSWVSADAITGLSDGDPVTTWSDRSAAANDFTSSGTARPLYKTSILNGEPVVRFDGSDDTMESDPISGTTARTILVVVKKRSAPSAGAETVFKLGNHSQFYADSNESATAWVWYQEDVTTTFTFGTAESWGIVAFRFVSTSTAKAYFGGGAGTSFDPEDIQSGSYQKSTKQTLGSGLSGQGQFADVDIAEYIDYDNAISLADLNDIGDYLSTKYGLTWTTAT